VESPESLKLFGWPGSVVATTVITVFAYVAGKAENLVLVAVGITALLEVAVELGATATALLVNFPSMGIPVIEDVIEGENR
jgi:hypothetical protein